MTAQTKRRAAAAYVWICACMPLLVLVGWLALAAAGDLRNPFGP